MNDDNKNEQQHNAADEQKKKEEPLHVHNPLKEEDDRQITQEDIENEEKFREALTERD